VPVPTSARAHSTFTFPGLRWWIATLVFLATVIGYIDRQTLSVLAPVICADLHLSNLQYAGIGTWFLIAYSGSMVLFGMFQDRVGTRIGFGAAMIVWSLAELGHAFARGLASLSLFRFLLGIGEGGHWPAATKTIAEWLPARERALGMGIANCGAGLGSAIAPPLIVWLELRYGWKTTFVATAALGFIWLALWFTTYEIPHRHRWLASKERDLIDSGRIAPGARPVRAGHVASNVPLVRWSAILRDPGAIGIVIARFFGDPVWWLYLIWFPLYLSHARGFSLKEIALFAWMPYVAADLGALSGGLTSGYLLRRGYPALRARGAAIAFSAALTLAGLLVAGVRTPAAAIFLISVVLFAFQFWVGNVQTLQSDLFPSEWVASVAGLSGTSAGLGAILFTLSTGWVVDHFSYRPILFVSGLLVPLGTIVLFIFLRSSQRAAAISPEKTDLGNE
jgi:MFS transporter, ACS family, hexuronate transporter